MNTSLPRPSPTVLPIDGLCAHVAAKLWARTGVWPWWFVWVVGDRVPPMYVRLGRTFRREMEQEFAMSLPRKVVRSKTKQLSLGLPRPAAPMAPPPPDDASRLPMPEPEGGVLAEPASSPPRPAPSGARASAASKYVWSTVPPAPRRLDP